MSRYVFAPAADADLVDIWMYTSKTWNRDQADRYTARLIDVCGRIAGGDIRGKRINNVDQKYLKASVGSHFVVFRRETDHIVIVRILHQRMDMPSLLQD